MSTNDVPGAKASNNDELAMGCWAEHKDGSLIFVESTEGDRVVYSVFDVSKDPAVEFRDTMPISGFKSKFSWNPSDPKSEKWLWKDKSPFDWDRVIGAGFADGVKSVHVEHQLNAAERVAQSRAMVGKDVNPDDYSHLTEKLVAAGQAIMEGIQGAISGLKK